MKKVVGFLASVFLVAVMLAGCAGDSSGSGEGGEKGEGG